MTLDVAIRNGRVVDGTGRAAYAPTSGSPATGSSRSARRAAAAAELDAAGSTSRPGFVDIHSHSDYTLLVDPRAVSALHQGVTTEIVGNCGHGCFPIGDPALAQRAIYGYSPRLPLTWRDAAGTSSGSRRRLPRSTSRASFQTASCGSRPSASRTGRRAARSATRWRLLEESLEQGAWGYSTGLEYAAERAAPPDELEPLCAALRPRGGLYATHTRRRDAGSRRGGARGGRDARAQWCPAAGVASRAPQRRGRDARLHRARRAGRDEGSTSRSTCTRASSGRRFSRRAPAGVSRAAAGSERRLEARRRYARWARTRASSARARTGRGSCCWTTTSGPAMRAATSPRSPRERGQTPDEAICDLLAAPEALGRA